LAWHGKTKPSTTKACIQNKSTTTQNKHKKLKPGLVALYDIRSGNAAGLFTKEKISKAADKETRA